MNDAHAVSRVPFILVYAAVAKCPEAIMLPSVLPDTDSSLRLIEQVALKFGQLLHRGLPDEVTDALHFNHEFRLCHQFLSSQFQNSLRLVHIDYLIQSARVVHAHHVVERFHLEVRPLLLTTFILTAPVAVVVLIEAIFHQVDARFLFRRLGLFLCPTSLGLVQRLLP